MIYRKELEEIDLMLEKLIKEDRSPGFIHKFRDQVTDYIHNPVLKEKINIIVLDNAFLSVLVYDFIYLFLLEYMVHITTNNINKLEERKGVKNVCLESAFLFPYRMRYINNNNEELNKGDFAIIDLIESKHYFSYGPRSCVGIGLTQKIMDTYFL